VVAGFGGARRFGRGGVGRGRGKTLQDRGEALGDGLDVYGSALGIGRDFRQMSFKIIGFGIDDHNAP
jgi:hypothetical protein